MESCDKEKKKKKILLHTVKMDVERFSYGEFYIIDLENEQVSELPHVLLADMGSNSMVLLGSAMYVVGCPPMGFMPCTKKPPNSNCNKKGIYHKGTSYMEDLTKLKLKSHHQQEQEEQSDSDDVDDDCDWKEAPCPEGGMSLSPCVVALGGKIYVFHIAGKIESADVFDPVLNEWGTLLPPPEVGFFDVRHTTSAIADPENDRILVHFYRNSSIFAYYPNPNLENPRWELLLRPAGWSANLILVDGGILFTYLPETPELVAAFHLPTQKYLNVAFTSPLSSNVWRYEFDDIISLGDGLFSLVADSYSPPHREVYFAKFRFHHLPDRPADILITPLSVQTITLHIDCVVCSYLLI